MQFNHVGVPTTEVQPGEIFVPETKVYVTRPNQHPLRLEFLRFLPDSPVRGPVREEVHLAFVVPELAEALAGRELLLGPFEPLPGLQVAFVREHGAVWEFMQFSPGHQAAGFLPEPAA